MKVILLCEVWDLSGKNYFMENSIKMRISVILVILGNEVYFRECLFFFNRNSGSYGNKLKLFVNDCLYE